MSITHSLQHAENEQTLPGLYVNKAGNQDSVIQLAQQVAHDMRAPLALLSALINTNNGMDQEVREMLETARTRFKTIATSLDQKGRDARSQLTLHSASTETASQKRGLRLNTGSCIVLVSNNANFIKLWNEKLSNCGGSLKLVHLPAIGDLREWYRANFANLDQTKYIFDLECSSNVETFLDIIAQLGIAEECILASGATSGEESIERILRGGVKHFALDEITSLIPQLTP